MNLDDAGVERIVRAVLDRLPADRILTTNRSTENEKGENITQRLDGHVVTLACIERLAKGVSTIEVPRGVVVTPAARDRLRELGMRLRVHGNTETKNNTRRILTAVVDTYAAIENVKQLLGRARVELEVMPNSGLVSVIDEMSREIRLSGRKGVLITGRAFTACCLANRHPRLRAAAAKSVAQVKAACEEMAANLLALNPMGRSTYEVSTMIKTFATSCVSPDQKNIIEMLN